MTTLRGARAWWPLVALAVAAVVLGLVGLANGPTWSSPGEVLAALTGSGSKSFVVTQWRLPRVLAALVLGAALGLAGAVFQNVTRNPLGSPDVIGLDSGAFLGALVALVLLQGTSAQLTGLSVSAGLLTAAAIYLLASRGGFSGLRLVVVGIAVNAMLVAVNHWLILRADLEVAMAGSAWSAGSLNGLDWADLALPFAVVALLSVGLATQARTVAQSSLGDDVASASGVDLRRHRLVVVALGVGCTATVTAVAGPVVFVALAAPQIGRRLVAAAGVPLLPAALTGAVLLLASDLTAQLLFKPVSLPVGVVTTAVGGLYLIWLLMKEVKR